MTGVLVAIPRVHEASHAGLERLRAAGCELIFNSHGRTLTEDELAAMLAGCFASIAGGERYSERVLAAAPGCKVVARMGVGYDAVDVAAATRHGVAVAMGFGTNHEPVADLALTFMAALGNRLFAYHQEVMEGRWGGHFHPGLWRSTVGILGLGRIGRAVARRCRGFEMRVLAYDPVADLALAFMAALGNRLFAYHREVMEGRWGGHFHPGLWRSTVGILGLGRIGRALARRCRGFEMRVLAYDPIADPAYAAAAAIELVGLEDVFREADFVSVHAPHSAATDKLVNRARLALMKPTAFLINTARGGLVDEGALIEALAEGRIAGAGLDVFEVEPLPAGSPLRGLPNVVLTPHCAGGSISAVAAMTERCVDNILAIRDGRSPGDEYLLNPEVLR